MIRRFLLRRLAPMAYKLGYAAGFADGYQHAMRDAEETASTAVYYRPEYSNYWN